MQQRLEQGDAREDGGAEPGEEQVAVDLVRDGEEHDQQRGLDTEDEPVELQRRGGPAGQRHPGGTRLGGGLLHRRLAGLVPGDTDQVGLRLDQDRAERGQGTEEGPQPVDTAGAPQVGGAQPEADQHGRVGEVGADPVQVDTGEGVLLAPAGDLAVDAVQQQVQLGGDHAEDRAPDPRHQQGRGREHTAQGHQVRELVGRDPGVHQVAVDAQGDLTHVEASRPVLTAAPVLHPGGVDDRTEFSYRWP